jgi:hypothetical protein
MTASASETPATMFSTHLVREDKVCILCGILMEQKEKEKRLDGEGEGSLSEGGEGGLPFGCASP